jgi:predicted dehydrogenase
MATRARDVGVVTMTPYTYRYMPVFVDVRHRIEAGFLGTPYHLNIRYFAGYGRDGEYSWRFDRQYPAAGVIGDLGSHLFHLAEWFLGPIESVGAIVKEFVPRAGREDGSSYVAAEDSAIITVVFRSGAIGTLQICAASWEGTASFGQTHHLDAHGSAGTIYASCDWEEQQTILAIEAGTPRAQADQQIAEESWQGARRAAVPDTYRDIFRSTSAMARGWVDAIDAGVSIEPDLAAGARVQMLLEAAMASVADDGRQVQVPM